MCITLQPGRSDLAVKTPLPGPPACRCKAHWLLSSECETFVVCS